MIIATLALNGLKKPSWILFHLFYAWVHARYWHRQIFFWNVPFFKAISFGFYQLFGFLPRPTLNHWHEGNLAYLMLITVVNAPDVNAPYHIWHEGHLSSCNEVDCQSQAERICGIWTGNLPLSYLIPIVPLSETLRTQLVIPIQ